MNARSFFLIGVFLSAFIIYKISTYVGEVEQQIVTVEHVKEGIALAKNAMTHVELYFKDFRSMPIGNNDAGLPHSSEMNSENVERVRVEGGRIIVKFKKYLQNGITFIINPEFTHSRPVMLEWRCNPGILNKQFFIEALPECLDTDSDINADLIKGIRTADLELMQEAIDDGADVNNRVFNMTPLFYAIGKRKIDIVQLLLQNGADIELSSDSFTSKTPLMYSLTNSSSEIAKFLVDQGADVNAKDIKGKSVLRYVRVNYMSADNEIRDYLIDAGAISDNY